MWAPTAQTDYIGFMSELGDIGTYAFNRIDSLIHTNLMFQSNGGHKEGFYYCTNAINFGCFVGVFQRNNLSEYIDGYITLCVCVCVCVCVCLCVCVCVHARIACACL